MKNRIVLLVALLLAVTCLQVQGGEKESSEPLFTFAQLTDTHMIAGKPADNVRSAIRDVNRLDPRPRFAVVTGDLINGEQPGPSTKLYREVLSDLECPFYSVRGNHDHRDCFEELLHPVNYSFQSEPYHFIVLDSVGKPAKETYGCRFSSRTVDWLEEHLKRVEKDVPIIVFSHASPYRPHSFTDKLPGDVYNYEAVVELLEPYRVVAWFAGHAHRNSRTRRDGVDYYVTGCVSNERSNGSVPLGYRLVRVFRDRVETEYRTIKQFPEARTDEDWPMWRHDARRSASTPASLPSGLQLHWQRKFQPPEPAFPRDIRLNFDATYQPVASGSTIFVPSMVTDSVTALDTRTGEKKWRFYAGGPVRFAPVVWSGRVYFVSDDGHLYCLDAADGSLEWKFWAPPEKRKPYRLRGNGRLISRWAARGGPVLKEGTVYFGCGLWPSEGVYVCAVDAESGELQWRSRSLQHIENGLVERRARRDVGLIPAGYLCAVGDRLIVPAGRALPAVFSRESGEMEPYSTGWGGRGGLARGSWWVAATGNYFMTSGELYGLTEKEARIDAPVPRQQLTPREFAETSGVPIETVEQWMDSGLLSTVAGDDGKLVRTDTEQGYLTGNKPGPDAEEYVMRRHPRLQVSPANQYNMCEFRRPVLTGDEMIYSVPSIPNGKVGRRLQTVQHGSRALNPGREGESYRGVLAYDIACSPRWGLTTSQNAPTARVRVWRTLQFDRLWSTPHDLRGHIKAGDRLYAGGPGVVVALNMNGEDAEPSLAWKKRIEGTPATMLAADGRLFVLTREGRLYCFGAGEPQHPERRRVGQGVDGRDESVDSDGAPDLPCVKGRKGYCLILGLPDYETLRSICRTSELRIVVLEPDPGNVRDARERLEEQGLYGTRVHVLRGDLSSVQPPPYMASLVIARDTTWAGAGAPKEFVERLSGLLRPHGGTACLSLSDRQHEELTKMLEGQGLQASRDHGKTLLKRTGAPKGSAPWMHESGGPANAFSNEDTAVKPPLGIVWFGSSLDRVWPTWDYTHSRPPRPLVCGGRMFFLISNVVHAVDVYTGLPLWQASLKQSPKTGSRRREHFIARRNTADNYIATPDILYVLREASCLMLDAETGSRLDELATPSGLARSPDREEAVWHEALIWENHMLVSIGEYLVCMDRHDGTVHWKVAAERDRLSFAAADGRVFTVDYWLPDRRRRGEEKDRTCTLRALDIETAGPLWQKKFELPGELLNSPRARWLQDNVLPLSPYLSYSKEQDALLLSASYSVVAAFRGGDGRTLWDYNQRSIAIERGRPPVLISDRFVTRAGRVYNLLTGEAVGERLWSGLRACNRAIANRESIFVRDGLAMACDFRSGRKTYFMSTRSGCTNNLIPADGVLAAPNFAVGCACNYPVITSFAAVHMPKAGQWRTASRSRDDRAITSRK